jgi:hypothetical protein
MVEVTEKGAQRPAHRLACSRAPILGVTLNVADHVLLADLAHGGGAGGAHAGSDDGGRRAAAIYTRIETAKLNDVDPRAWLADVLARLLDHPAKRIGELLPWNWKPQIVTAAAA